MKYPCLCVVQMNVLLGINPNQLALNCWADLRNGNCLNLNYLSKINTLKFLETNIFTLV